MKIKHRCNYCLRQYDWESQMYVIDNFNDGACKRVKCKKEWHKDND